MVAYIIHFFRICTSIESVVHQEKDRNAKAKRFLRMCWDDQYHITARPVPVAGYC